jgi:hypothetical protein
MQYYEPLYNLHNTVVRQLQESSKTAVVGF